jgi:hypothetical protein
MSVNDPRQYIKDILTSIVVTKDNNVTVADVVVLYEGGPESFMHLFYVNQYDAVITLGRHRDRASDMMRSERGVPLRYIGDVPVYVNAIDKTGITATKLLNKIRRAIIVYTETVAYFGPWAWWGRVMINVETTNDAKQIMGGYDPMWQDEIHIIFKPASTEG